MTVVKTRQGVNKEVITYIQVYVQYVDILLISPYGRIFYHTGIWADY